MKEPKALAALLAVAAALPACSMPTREEQLLSYRTRCAMEFGFVGGTPQFANCMMMLDMEASRRFDAGMRSLSNSFGEASRAMETRPVVAPPPQPAWQPFPSAPAPAFAPPPAPSYRAWR